MPTQEDSRPMDELRTRATVKDWRTDFDHFDTAFVADPDVIWADLRTTTPVAHSDRYGGLTVLTRWQDVAAVAANPSLFSSRRTIVDEVPTSRRLLPLPPLNIDPPEHAAQRRVLLPFFNAVATERWEQPVREICRQALDAMGERVDVDLAVDYAQVIPGELTAMMLGVPTTDVPQFRVWLHDLLEVGPTDVAVARRTTTKILDYLRGQLEQRRQHPGDDLVSYLIDQRIENQPVPDNEIVKMLVTILVAGIDTTWSGIGSSLMHLAGNAPDCWRLGAQPELIPGAVEEFLRFYPPGYPARIAQTNTEIGGRPIAAGEWVLLGLPAANRDPEMFDRPERLIIDRQANRHTSFGLGIHRCLGSNLARMEMGVAIEEFLARFPDFELRDPEAIVFSAGQVRGPRCIPARILARVDPPARSAATITPKPTGRSSFLTRIRRRMLA